MTHLVMFDIDGTLVDSMRVDSHLYARAVRETLGGDVYIDETWRPYVHVTDSGILDEILVQHRFAEPLDELRAEVKRRFIELVRGHLDAAPRGFARSTAPPRCCTTCARVATCASRSQRAAGRRPRS